MKRTFLSLTLALGVMFATVLAPTADAGNASPTLKRILDRGELIVGMTGEQPPLSMKNKSGEIIGLDADLAQLMAGGINVKLNIVTKPFAELLPAVASGDVDMVISGITITPERNMKVAFVGPYFVSGKSILSKSAVLADLDTVHAINDPKFTFAALAGSTSEIFVKELLDKASLKTAETYAAATALVREGEADALIADLPYCVFAGLRDTTGTLDALAEPLTFEPLGIALPPNDPLLVNLVQNVLTSLEGTGALESLSQRWFEDDSWLSDLP